MRILMICKACVVGIYQRKLEEMAQQADLDLTVLVPSAWRDPSGVQPLERVYTRGYRLEVVPLSLNGNFHLHFYPTLGQIVRRLHPHLVHIDEEPYNLAAWQAFWLAKRIGAKALFFSWQNILRRYPPPFSLGEAWLLRRADGAIVGTQGAADVLRAKGCRLPIAIIPQFGIDPELFKPAEVQPAEPIFGFFGRLVPEKGADLLLRAAAQLRAAGHAFRLRIVGQGAERAKLEQLAQALGLSDQVAFLGQVPSMHMPRLYADLTALVVPSRTLPNWKEQFGRVIVEAMASGVPVIGAHSGAIPDVIGTSGLLFPEDDLEALTAHMARLLTDPSLRAELAHKGRARVLAHFTHAQIAAQTVAFYRQLLQRA
ncbi:MAG: glycosyl transferase family 1 [Candidatus Thermofonsia Clade 1 bacterium]|jgi:glycosyltransferase involved in cell wall biosynthesis|uniref:Glycosyl transferase family 1 n=1 Tax=Candidatus Thermofonsia Clade 1 bacterium TaxID=2364210 RepID=A0A2M8PBX5_9CHLR|nr:MAG: glycosyl transferase family 1 [Candidatus Thermofonsia Clade 1 bacterium]RMF52434.1 MAG: glycosyltransferase family 1 protein [Chloroflexota bacterium]